MLRAATVNRSLQLIPLVARLHQLLVVRGEALTFLTMLIFLDASLVRPFRSLEQLLFLSPGADGNSGG